MKAICNELGKRLLYFDGGMGTLLQAMGLTGGERPETWNLAYPDRILDVHRRYLEAGCDIVTTNTFGATAAHLGEDAPSCMRAGVRIAREAVSRAGHGYVAADMGPSGRLLVPYGDLPFEDAVRLFEDAFAAALGEGPDLILIETMTDLAEVKACVLGAKQALKAAGKQLPLFVSLTFDERGRLLTGADIPGTAAMLEGLGVTAIGLNCGHEPSALMDNVRVLAACSKLPFFVQPNASLPVVVDGKTVFPTTPEDFARDMVPMVQLGAWALGGCCGTTPAHIERLVSATRGLPIVSRETLPRCVISGRTQSLSLDEGPVIIGERLNPTGKKRLKQALREGDMDAVMREAIAQTDAGAHALDVNVGLPELDEPACLTRVVQAVQSVCDVPLQLDTADPRALEAAMRVYIGRPLVNSVCGKQAVMDAVFPLVREYGGAVVALTLDEGGIPDTVQGRLDIAGRIVQEAARYGIPSGDLLFDALTLTIATDSSAAAVTLETVRELHRKGLKTILGVSNVSFGLPNRPAMTASFLSMALAAGLDAAILNPLDPMVSAAFWAGRALTGADKGVEGYLQAMQSLPPLTAMPAKPAPANVPAAQDGPETGDALFRAIRGGLAGDARLAAKALLDGGSEPLSLIEGSVMPALTEVGTRYERGELFLPQLLQSANAAQAAFEPIRERLPAQAGEGAGRVVLATVHGDVHDIGKNIVKVLLQNYGFAVTDLGKDVPPARVLDAVRETGARLVGLSALMTTTVPAMRDTIALLKKEAPGVTVVVGGAVLTQAYADQIGADHYAPDAMATVRVAQQVLC